MTIDEAELKRLSADAGGFHGKFQFGAYDDGTEQLEYVGRDVGEPYVVAKGIERHVAEPIARMLNAVPQLIEEVKRLRSIKAVAVRLAYRFHLSGRELDWACGECCQSGPRSESRCDVHKLRALGPDVERLCR